MKKRILFVIIFNIVVFPVWCQPNFVVDTILLPGQYIQKVSAARSSDVWVIEDTSSRNIYRIDENLSIYNHSLAFQLATNNAFTAILNNDLDNTLVGTTKDFVFHWNNSNISKLNALNGLIDSTINGIVGFPRAGGIVKNPGGDLKPQILVSGNKSQYFRTNDYINFNATTPSQISNLKVLERERVYSAWWGYTYHYSLYTFRGNHGMQVNYADGISVYAFYDVVANWQNVNTATIFYDFQPRILIGMNDKMIAQKGNNYYTLLVGNKVNKIIKYHYDSNYALIGTDSCFFIADYFASGWPPVPVFKPTFPENTFKVNDVDVSPDGCVWLATDTGAVRLKDINCNNYNANFTISDTLLTLNDKCEIKFNSGCLGCTKNWNWSFGDGNNSILPNPSHIYGQSGTYTVSLISGNGVCLDTVSKSVSILICCDSSKYNFAKLGKDTIICNNDSIYLDAGNCFNCNYLWSTGASTQIINVDSAGSYWVKLQNQGGCYSYDTINVSVNNIPVSFSGLSNNYCLNSPISALTGFPSGGTFSGKGITGNIYDPKIAGVGIDTVTYMYTDVNGCSNTSSEVVMINAPPVINFSGLSGNYCIDEPPANLIVSPSGGVFSGNGISGNVFNPTNAGVGTHVIMYSFTDINGCSNNDTQQVVVNSVPTTNISGTTTICSGQNTTLTANGGNTYSWNTGATTSAVTVAPITNASYTVTVYNADGCSNTATQLVSVNPLPSVLVSGDSVICSGETITLTASGIGNFVWSTGNSTNMINVSPTSITTYSVTSTNSCGTVTDAIEITVNPLPVTTVSNDTTLLYGSSVQLFATGGLTYSWSPASGLSCTSCQNPIATPQTTTTYFVTITDANSCSVTEQITLTVDENFEIFVPDIFSPNNDGHNDVLYVRGTGIKELHFIVYDRLGEKIFESNDVNKGWDGTYKGSPLNEAVFVYYVSATMINDKKIKAKGDVTLSR